MLSAFALIALTQLPPPLRPLPKPIAPTMLAMMTRPTVPRYEPPRSQRIPAGATLSYFVEGLPGRSSARAWQLSGQAVGVWAAWADVDFLPTGDRRSADIVIRPESIWRGYLGLTDMSHPSHYKAGRKGVVVRINPNFSGDDELMLRILTHELGHALGLDHVGSLGQTMSEAVHSRTPFTQSDGTAAARLWGYRKVAN